MLKDHVIASVKPDDYYERRFPTWNKHVKSNIPCIFHEDNKPSLAIALKNGGAKCHASTCGKSIGNIVHFEAESLGVSEKLAARKLYREFVRPVISKKVTADLRSDLLCSPEYLGKIKKEMGLSLAYIRQFNLGLDTTTHRITIPVYDQFKNVVNIRYYRLPSERSPTDAAKIYNKKGYGKLDLFPWTRISEFKIGTPVFFMASEKEAMLANQLGLNAFCTTSGEGSWDDLWNYLVTDRTVYLVFDRDKGGAEAEEKFLKRFATVAKSVNVIHLPFSSGRKDWKDFADWIIKDKGQAKEMVKYVVRSTKRPKVKKVKASEPAHYPPMPEFHSEELYDLASISSDSELLNKRIRTQGIVAAKSPNTYSIPWRFSVKVKNRPSIEYTIDMGRELMRFVRANDTQILQTVQKLVGSAAAEVTPIAFLTATEVEVIPTAVIDRDVPYVVQRCFYFGDRIEANTPYYLEIIPTSEIRSQETIGIITHREPIAKSIDKFDYTPENLAELYFMQPEEDETIWQKFANVSNEIAARFTRVYNRLDWHMVALLTWASPIGFRFPNEPELQRGWINSLALGDTETGKSKVSKALQGIFNCGVFVNAENCTYVGLVGGAIKMGSGQLMLRWGRIPLSDKQLVVLEELSGLSVEEISNMSDVRSSGIARLDKGGINSETNSRTRLLCLSNVRSQRRSLSQNLSGVYAIQELVGHGEDIARFDLITTLVDNEVSIDVINSRSEGRDNFATVANPISANTLKKLIHFIWSLQPDQIRFDEAAYNECLEQTKRLSSIYHPSVPIFKGGSGRYKLGRIAAAIACFQFAWGNNQKINVSKGHVACAAQLLESIYTKQSFGYAEYSEQMFDRERVKDVKLLTKTFMEKIPLSRLPKVLEALVHSTRFTRDEMQAVAGVAAVHSDTLIGVMIRERALRKGDGNLWEITPAGKNWMVKLMNSVPKRKTK